MGQDDNWAKRITKHKMEFDDYWQVSYAVEKYKKKLIKKVLEMGKESDEWIMEMFEISKWQLEQIKKEMER